MKQKQFQSDIDTLKKNAHLLDLIKIKELEEKYTELYECTPENTLIRAYKNFKKYNKILTKFYQPKFTVNTKPILVFIGILVSVCILLLCLQISVTFPLFLGLLVGGVTGMLTTIIINSPLYKRNKIKNGLKKINFEIHKQLEQDKKIDKTFLQNMKYLIRLRKELNTSIANHSALDNWTQIQKSIIATSSYLQENFSKISQSPDIRNTLNLKFTSQLSATGCLSLDLYINERNKKKAELQKAIQELKEKISNTTLGIKSGGYII